MRIGHYFSYRGVHPGLESRISGHVRLPMKAIDLQLARGQEVELITTQFSEGHVLGLDLPEGLLIHQTPSSRGPSAAGAHSPMRTARSVFALRELVRRRNYDVLHVWGFSRTAELGGLLRLSGLPMPVVSTLFGAPAAKPSFGRWQMWQQLDAIIASTRLTQQALSKHGVPVRLIRHGAVRDLMSESAQIRADTRQDRVLFWRELTESNGGDIAMAAFAELAPQFPNLTFTLAVRPSGESETAMDWPDLPNLEVHRAPYLPGMGLADLVAQALCIVLPFRSLSMNPQMALIESLAAGVPVVTTDVASNHEFVQDGFNGAMVPANDISATASAIESIISDPDWAAELGRNAAQDASTFDWDQFDCEILATYEDAIG